MRHFNVHLNILLATILLSAGLWACQTKVTPPEGTSAALAAAPMAAPSTNMHSNAESQAFLMGQFDPATHPDFVQVGAPYSERAGMMLRREAYDAFVKMFEAAKADGISLKIISSTRTFAQQKAIWEGKWQRFATDHPQPTQRALKILEYSSMPGSSRHHWGTDIDLNALTNDVFEGNGPHKKVYDWLIANASRFGYGQPYTPKGEARPHGYNEEKWHWSYLPLSKGYRTQFLSEITNADIKGFKGSETAPAVDAVGHYVGGVAADCQ
jgi:zinc D-Ala-D-Ala carboxypeptidase